ncbi:RecQ family ATP-dependent DNA helicase [Bacillaceae bacterium W0354]
MNQLINLEDSLKRIFGHTSFREGQKEIINSVLKGNHTLGTLPTGSGKSICYQLPAMILDGLTVVVSPLISLMVDQVKLLKYQGIKNVVAVNSLMNMQEKQIAINQLNKYKLIYCSPEMLQQPLFINKLKAQKISLFVIDEAHCISQWGHEFRPDYLRLKESIKLFNDPTVLALSATATPQIQNDISKQLDINLKRYIYPIDRTNITYMVQTVEDENRKNEELFNVLEKNKIPTMIYFSSRKVSERLCTRLQRFLPDRNIAYYHGGMSQEDRILIQQQFMQGQLDIICCTSAFGMGINKNDIRLVIHYHIPSTIESFIQETGRAGRDGGHSVSLLLYSPGDEMIPYQLIESELPSETDVYNFVVEKNKTDDLIEMEGLTEVQQRFLTYHYENLNDYRKESDKIIEQLIEIRNKRAYIKKRSIHQILSWISQSNCRRKSLFQPFQENIREADFDCCDHCGFDIYEWKLDHTLVQSTFETNWTHILKVMFNRR